MAAEAREQKVRFPQCFQQRGGATLRSIDQIQIHLIEPG